MPGRTHACASVSQTCMDHAAKVPCLRVRHHGGSWHPCIAIYHTGLWLHTIVGIPLWNLHLQHSDWATAGRGQCQSDVRAGEGETFSDRAPAILP